VINATANPLEIAKEFSEEQNATMIKLEEHQSILRAQDMLMRQRNLNEEEAYQMLQDMAKKRNMKLTEIANQLIETAKRLTI
jgi:AmiR/NasT family two-component response regulator